MTLDTATHDAVAATPKPDERPRLAHMPALDGLRGAAVAAVVAFHLGHLPGGWLGVDLFFVLSGFLITALLLTEAGTTDRIDLVRFWGRRARRLLPALGVLLVAVALYAWYVAPPEQLHQLRWDGLATAGYVANWREVFAGVDYWSMFSAPSPLNHAWSLAIEEQFYLVWPLVFVGIVASLRRSELDRRRLARRVLVVSAGLAVASLGAAGVLQYLRGWDRVYFGTDTRAFAILLGAGAAAGWVGFADRVAARRGLMRFGGIVGLGVLAAAWMWMDGASWIAHHGGLAACSVAGVLVIVRLVFVPDGALARLFAFAPLRLLGVISYGVYLYHWPLIVWSTPERVHLSGAPLQVLQVVATLVVSIVSYRFVEQPIRRGRRWRPVPSVVVPVAGFATVMVLLVVSTAGAPPTGSVDRVDGAGGDGPRIMVIGNSVAHFVAHDGFAHLDDPRPVVLNRSLIACSEPSTELLRRTDGSTTDRFGATCDNGWSAAAEDFAPEWVVYLNDGTDPASFLHDGEWLSPCSSEFAVWARSRFASIRDQFAEAGATLVLVTGVPSVQLLRTDEEYAGEVESTECADDVFRSLADEDGAGVRLVDLERWMCPEPGRCRTELDDGTSLRPDGTHFRGDGARFVAEFVMERAGITGVGSGP